jgi:hypothetical protein
MEDISREDREILYRWNEGDYTFRQLVWDEEQRDRILRGAQEALELYCTSEQVNKYPVIRPWSFPSSFPETWEELEAFSSRASRIGFPPIHGLEDDTC